MAPALAASALPESRTALPCPVLPEVNSTKASAGCSGSDPGAAAVEQTPAAVDTPVAQVRVEPILDRQANALVVGWQEDHRMATPQRAEIGCDGMAGQGCFDRNQLSARTQTCGERGGTASQFGIGHDAQRP